MDYAYATVGFAADNFINLLSYFFKGDINFEVIEIKPDDCNKVFEITSLWIKVAREKIKQTTDNRAFVNVREIIIDVNEYYDYNARLFICRDKALGTPLCIAMARNHADEVISTLWISFIFSNPEHIKHALNPEATRGAGNFLLKHLKQLSIYEGKNSLSLKPIDDEAAIFFKKCGFGDKNKYGHMYLNHS